MDVTSSKKKVFLVIGNSNSGKDYLYGKMKEYVPDIERVSGGDFCKEVAAKYHGYDGVSKTEKDRKILNQVSKIYRNNISKVLENNMYEMFLTKDELTEYSDKDSFWAYLLINKIRKSEASNFMMTDLRFEGEYNTFMKYNNEFDFIFVELYSVDSIKTVSDYELEKLSIYSIGQFKNNYILFNSKNEEFDIQIKRMIKVIYDFKLDSEKVWAAFEKQVFYADNMIYLDVLQQFVSDGTWDLNVFDTETDYMAYILFLLIMKYATSINPLERIIGYYELQDVCRYIIHPNENIKKYIMDKCDFEENIIQLENA